MNQNYFSKQIHGQNFNHSHDFILIFEHEIINFAYE